MRNKSRVFFFTKNFVIGNDVVSRAALFFTYLSLSLNSLTWFAFELRQFVQQKPKAPFSWGGDFMGIQFSPSIQIASPHVMCKSTSSSPPFSLSLFPQRRCNIFSPHLHFPILSRDFEFQKICLIVVPDAVVFPHMIKA